MKKRVLSVIMCLMLIIGMLPMTAFAQENSGTDIVSFSDTTEELSDDEAVSATEQTTEQTTEFVAEQSEEEPLSPTEAEPEDVLNAKDWSIYVGYMPFNTSSQQEISLDSGKAKLDTTTTPYTLTLTNASTAYGYSPEDKPNIFAGIYSTVDLKIVLVGNSYLTLGSTSANDKINYGIYAPGRDITFEGDGKLTIDIAKRDGYGCSGIYCSTATFNGGTYDISVQTKSSEKTYAIETGISTQINGGRFLLAPDTEIYGVDYGKCAYAFNQSPHFSTAYGNSAKIKVCDKRGNDFVDWDGSTLLNNYCGVRINEPGYGIWVNGKEFTPSYTRIEFADGGVASYKRIGNYPYIVLDNVNITKATQIPGTKMYAGIWTNNSCPNIMLIGENSIELTGSYDTLCGIFSGIVADNTAGFSTNGLTFNEDSDKGGSLKIDLKGSGNCYGTYSAQVSFNSGDCDFYAETSESTAAAYAVISDRYVPSLSGGNQKLEAVNTGGGIQKAFAFDPSMTDKYLEKNSVYVSYGSHYSLWDGVTPISNYSAFMSSGGLHYGVWVNGVEFTEKNTVIACGNGTASLDTTTTPWTVTLNNATIKDITVQCPSNRTTYASGIYSDHDITIKLVGDNMIRSGLNSNIISGDTSLISSAVYACIGGEAIDVTLTGSGDLELYANDAVHIESSVDTYEHGILTIDGGNTTGIANAIYCNGFPTGIVYRKGNFEIYSADPANRYTGVYNGMIEAAQDASECEVWLYQYNDYGGYADWIQCPSIEEYNDFSIGNIYSGIRFASLVPLPDEMSLTLSPANGCEVGQKVTMTATGGSTYKFYYECAGSWVRIQDFSTANTCTWTPAKSGNYNLYCDIKDANGNVTAKKIAYKVTGAEPLKVSLSFQYASPQTAGTTIKITANATGGKGALKYKFYSECNGVWTKLWDYDTRTTYNWHATTVGTHTLYCDVMDEAGTVVCAVVSYQIVKGTEFVADLNANRISGQLTGTEIRLLGGSSNGVGTVQYKFYYELDGNWVRLSDFTTQDYFLWTPTKAGYYNVYLDAKDSAGHTASKRLCITIDEGQTLKVTSVTFDPTTGKTGTSTTITAKSTGGSGTVTYKFYYEMNGAWVKLQDFSTAKTCSWKPTKAGTYHIYVDAIDGTKNTQCLMVNYVVK